MFGDRGGVRGWNASGVGRRSATLYGRQGCKLRCRMGKVRIVVTECDNYDLASSEVRVERIFLSSQGLERHVKRREGRDWEGLSTHASPAISSADCPQGLTSLPGGLQREA